MHRFSMPRLLRIAALLLIVGGLQPATAQLNAPERARFKLATPNASVTAGSEIEISAQVEVDAGWHVNANPPSQEWLIATELEVQAPAGWRVGEVSYPPGAPFRFAGLEEEISVYDGIFDLPVRIRVPVDSLGTVPIEATLRYQACDDRQCLPPKTAKAELDLVVVAASAEASSEERTSEPDTTEAPREGALLPLGSGSLLGGDAADEEPARASFELLAERNAAAPGQALRLIARVEIAEGWHLNSNPPSEAGFIPTELELSLPEGWEQLRLAYPPGHAIPVAFTDQPFTVYDGEALILAEIQVPAGATGTHTLNAVLSYQACDDHLCERPTSTETTLQLQVGTSGQNQHAEIFARLAQNEADYTSPAQQSPGTETVASAAANTSTSNGDRSLLGVLFLGMIGGLLLNAMPCVLPVLSLKVFGLVKSLSEGRAQLVAGCLATTAGILVSFWLLALVAVLARTAGAAVGWGVQFQQPAFVAFLAVVVMLFALNLWGLFEIPLPQSLARAGGSAAREGLAGHFAAGLFATLMATPCSAPFLGPAVGFALGQPASIIFAMFTAVALGLAMPFLLLAAFPKAAGWLPKPGNWMLTLKGVMGFLLSAAAVWLFYVLAAQVTSESLAAIQLALLTLALAVWLSARNSAGGRRLWSTVAVLAAVGTVYLAAVAPRPAKAAGATAANGIAWQPFDSQQALALASEGKPVFVDFTADWCLNCKVIENTVLSTESVANSFREHDVVPMKADWTHADPEITAVLKQFGRAAVPFYLLYRPGQEPHAFGEVVTPGGIQRVLEESAAMASVTSSQ